MSENTPNSPRRNPPAEKLPIEPWTLRQAANWILFRDFARAQRAEARSLLQSGFYTIQYNQTFPTRFEEETDKEFNDRIEACLEKQKSDVTTAQAELIESLKNSSVKAHSVGNDGATLPADAWKSEARTFFRPGDARVYSDEVMTKWPPNGHPACTNTENAVTETIGAETSMKNWLESQIKAAPNAPLTKQTLRQQAIQSGILNVSDRAFERAYRAAVENSGCDAWSKGGRRPKSPHP